MSNLVALDGGAKDPHLAAYKALMTPHKMRMIQLYIRGGKVPIRGEEFKMTPGGMSTVAAGSKVGIPSSHMKVWVSQGTKDPDGPYGKFVLAVERARADFMEAVLEKLDANDKQNWTKQATILERVFPETFAKVSESKSTVTHQGFDAKVLAEAKKQAKRASGD